jgi:DNA-binding MarR family transcriptional regulator
MLQVKTLDVKKLLMEDSTMAEGSQEQEQEQEQDHVDRFLAEHDLPGVDLEVEGIVERIQGLRRRFARMGDETLKEHGLGESEWKLLNHLRLAGEPFQRSPGKLAKRAELSTGAMTNRLDRMEESGLVRRLPDPEDRRGVLVELTEEGHRVWEQALGAQAAKESLIAAALDKEERRQLNVLLRGLMREFERREERDS